MSTWYFGETTSKSLPTFFSLIHFTWMYVTIFKKDIFCYFHYIAELKYGYYAILNIASCGI